MTHSTAIPKGFKKCSQGENCIHPDGPVLPRTEEYFYMSKGHASARCRPCMLAYRKEHHERNREHDNARSLEYVRRNKKQVYARRDEYMKTYERPPKTEEWIKRHRANSLRYLARKRLADGDHTAEDIDLIYKSQQGRCWYCQCELNGEYDVDHRIPLIRGGSNGPENLVIACKSCNRSKRSKLPHEWNGRLL